MQLTVSIDYEKKIQVTCPGCDATLAPVIDQQWSERLKALSPPTERLQDHRVRIMLHPSERCIWSNQKFRVDCLSGYAELWPEEVEHALPESPQV